MTQYWRCSIIPVSNSCDYCFQSNFFALPKKLGNPNLQIIFSEGSIKLFATRTIKRHEELTIDYIFGNSWQLHFHTRRLLLYNERHFICRCERCTWELTAKHVYKGDEYEPAPVAGATTKEEDILLTDEEKEKQVQISPKFVLTVFFAKKQSTYARHRKLLNPHVSDQELEKAFKNLVITKRRMAESTKDEEGHQPEFKNSFRSKAIREDVAKLIQGFDVLNSRVDIKRFLMELVEAHRALNGENQTAAAASPHNARRAQTLAYLADENWPLLGVIITNLIHYEVNRQIVYHFKQEGKGSNKSKKKKKSKAVAQPWQDDTEDKRYGHDGVRKNYLYFLDFLILKWHNFDRIEQDHHSSLQEILTLVSKIPTEFLILTVFLRKTGLFHANVALDPSTRGEDLAPHQESARS